MAQTISTEDLRHLIDAMQNATDDDARAQAQENADKIMQAFVADEMELADDALVTFGDFLEIFAQTKNEDGQTVAASKLAEQAMAKYEAVVNAKTNKPDQESVIVKEVKNRIYSLNSDANQIKFDLVTFGVYQTMGLIAGNINPNNLTPAAIATEVTRVKLTPEQRAEYTVRFIDVVINDMALFESVPPSILADAYLETRKQISEVQDEEQKKVLLQRFAALAARIDFLIENFNSQINYWYVDPTNIVDVHAGYTKMFDARQPDLMAATNDNQATKDHKQRIQSMIDANRDTITKALAEYDELYHLMQINPENAEELKQRWIDLKQRLSQIEITPEVLAIAAKYHFLDEQGQPIPQFLDEQGQPSLEYREGCTLNPNGRLAQVINLSRNDVTMENVANLGTQIADMNLQEMLDEEVPWTFSEISIPDQVAQGIAQDPKRMTDEAQIKEFWDNINANGGNISDQGYQAALDAHVNHAAGFAGRLADKLGPDADIVYMPFQAVEDIDKLAGTRTEKEGAEGRTQKVGFFKRMLKNFGMAATVSAGLTFIGKATGIAWAGAAIGTTIGVGNMIYQSLKWRSEQKKLGKPHSLKDFLGDKRNWGPAVATGLGVAATISMATGNPELAMGFGLGAVAVGTGSAVAMTYQDAVNAGYTRGQALAGAIGVGASGILGAWAGHAAMNGIVNYVNNNTESTLFKHAETAQTATTEYEETIQRQYQDGVIEGNESILNRWEDPATLNARLDGLMDAGLTHDDAVRYLLAYHDATDHYLGPGYFNSIGMSDAQVAALRASINGTEIYLTPESIAAFEHFNPHISGINQVGYVPGAPTDFQLPPNAMYDSNGVLVHGNELYTTYANHSMPVYQDTTIYTPITTYGTETIFTPNELLFPAGIGTFGIYEPRIIPDNYLTKLRERAGSLADKIEIQRKREPNGPDDPVEPDDPKKPDDPVEPDDPKKPDDDDKKKRRFPPEHDLELDAKLNMDQKNADAAKILNVKVTKVDGKMDNVEVVSNVDNDSMHIQMTVPYSLNQGRGYYKVVYKTFRGEIQEARVTSRATEDGIHIDIVMDGVSIKNKGRYKLYFAYVEDEENTEHHETITKKTRFKQKKTTTKEIPAEDVIVKPEVPAEDITVVETPKPEVPAEDVTVVETPKPEVPAEDVIVAETPKPEIPAEDVAVIEAPKPEVPAEDVAVIEAPKPTKRGQFKRATANVQTLEEMLAFVSGKEQRAKKAENISVWRAAHEQLVALEQNQQMTPEEKQARAAEILAAAQSTVHG